MAKPTSKGISITRLPRTGLSIPYWIEDNDLTSLPEALTIQIRVGKMVKRWDFH